MSVIRDLLVRFAAAFRKRESDFVSLVVLMRSPLRLSINELHEALESLFPGQFHLGSEGGPDSSFAINGPDGPTGEPSYFIKSLIDGKRGIFLLHDASRPYGVPMADASVNDQSRVEIESQTAWFSVDLLQGIGEAGEAYRFISTVIAKLTPPDALALLDPSRQRVTAFSEDVRRALRANEDVFAARKRVDSD